MSDTHLVKVNRALISVSDKAGIVEFARPWTRWESNCCPPAAPIACCWKNGLKVTEVADYTGFPEMMDGRVKTLHPKVHGGILARRGQDDAVMAEHGIEAIDMVVVNLYPFEATVAKPGCSLEDAIENIDIGGPTMVRAAAKNHRFVNIVVNAADYDAIIAELKANGGATSLATRFDLAIKAYEHTAAYDGAIANHFGRLVPGGSVTFPAPSTPSSTRCRKCATAKIPTSRRPLREAHPAEAGIATAKQIQGKELSYNNVADTDAALERQEFRRARLRHRQARQPCGVAVAADIGKAYQLAFATDPESAFGGIIAFNRDLDAATASAIVDSQFVEVIIAPAPAPKRSPRSPPRRTCACWCAAPGRHPAPPSTTNGSTAACWCRTATWHGHRRRPQGRQQGPPSEQQMKDLLFAWKVAKFVKSNAIIYAANGQTVGVGAGQMSRINSARIAAIKAEHAGLVVKGSVMASDAFFPFRDGIDNAGQAGIAAVIQPGGSIRDDEVIAAADEYGMAMVFTGMRHFRH